MSGEGEQSMAIGHAQLDQGMSSAITGSLAASHNTQGSRNWPGFLRGVTLFDNAVPLGFAVSSTLVCRSKQ